jgi:hypothetical protein
MQEFLARIYRAMSAAKTPKAPSIRHLFAIEPLSAVRSACGCDYRYYCMRCYWLFMVDRHGSVVALDERQRPLAIDQGEPRVRTFAFGPCTGTAPMISLERRQSPARVTRIDRRRRTKVRVSASR